jgi:hypothetical protein
MIDFVMFIGMIPQQPDFDNPFDIGSSRPPVRDRLMTADADNRHRPAAAAVHREL